MIIDRNCSISCRMKVTVSYRRTDLLKGVVARDTIASKNVVLRIWFSQKKTATTKSESVRAPCDRALFEAGSYKNWLLTEVMLPRIRERWPRAFLRWKARLNRLAFQPEKVWYQCSLAQAPFFPGSLATFSQDSVSMLPSAAGPLAGGPLNFVLCTLSVLRPQDDFYHIFC